MTRDDAYRDRAAQRDARRGRSAVRSATCSRADPDVAARSTTARLDACFDLKRALANVDRTFDALDDRCDAGRRVHDRDEQARAAAPLHRARSASSTRSATTACSMVATDRVSVFDVVLPDHIPDKGRVLTALVDVLVRADRATSSPTT